MRGEETQPDNKEMVTRETAASGAIDFGKGMAKPIRWGGLRPKHQPA